VALLIATYDYQDAGLRQLTAPAHDAEALAAVLRDPGIAGFEVTALINEPHYRAGEAIASLYRDRRRDDLTLLYFTGHGLKDDEGRLYLAMTNTQRGSLLFTSLAAEQVDQAMSGCMSRRNVLILDCCYSGAFPAGQIAKADSAVHALERFQGRGRAVLTASDATQYSFEGDQPHGAAAQSVFTRHLVAGLRDGSADLDGDGDITIDELYSYVHDHVVDEMPQQRPKKQDSVQGRIVIARNINWSLPAYLQHALNSPIAAERIAGLDGLANLYRIGNDQVRQHVTGEIQRLAGDDSRAVSAAAAARLQAFLPRDAGVSPVPAPQPAPQPEPAAATRATPPGTAAGPAVPRGQAHRARIGETIAGLGAGLSGRARGRTRRVTLTGIAGVLAVLAAALLATGIGTQSLGAAFPRYTVWYVIPMAAVALTAGVCTLLPRTRSLTGPGLLIGTAAASVWGLALSYGYLPVSFGTLSASRIVFPGQVALALAACLTVFALYRKRAVQLGLRRPGSPLTWVMIILSGASAAVSALALAGYLYQAAHLDELHRQANLAAATRPYLAATVLAAIVPAWAAAVTPGRFAISLLAGWIAGSWAICLGTFAWIHGSNELLTPSTNVVIRGIDELDTTYAIVFGGALLCLTAAAAVLGRWAATAEPVLLRRRSALVTWLAVITLLAGTGAVAVQLVARIPVMEAQPLGVAVSRDGHRLYVTMVLENSSVPDYSRVFEREPGRLTVIDTASDTAIGSPVSSGTGASGVADSRDGAYVYVASTGANSVSVVSALEDTTVGNPIPIGHRPTSLTVSADGRSLLVADEDHGVSVIDTRSNTVSRRIALPSDSGAVAVSPDGRHIYASNGGNGGLSVTDTTTGHTTTGPAPLGYSPDSMTVSPDGRRLYAAGMNETSARSIDILSVIDTTTLNPVGSPGAPLGTGPHSMAVSPDGRRLYVTNVFEGTVSVIDTESGAVGAPVPVGGGPVSVTVSPDGHRVYVALLGESKVAVFTSDALGTVSLINLTAH
jgi:YVTN family beta-propeller protein